MPDQENLTPEFTQLLAGVCQTLTNYLSVNGKKLRHDLHCSSNPHLPGQASFFVKRNDKFALYVSTQAFEGPSKNPYSTLRIESSETHKQSHYRFSAECTYEGNTYVYFLRINASDLQAIFDAVKFFAQSTVDTRLGELTGTDIQKAVEGVLGINQLTAARVIRVDQHYDLFAGASFSRAAEGPTQKGHTRPRTTPPTPRPATVH